MKAAVQHTPLNSNTSWCLQDAKAQFSALVEGALRGVPQHVSRRGKQAVVVLSADDFAALQLSASTQAAAPRSFSEHLLAMPKQPAKPAAKAPTAPALNLQPRELDFS